MKLAVSNIAWDIEASQVLYERMKKYGFAGLEIAPTKFFAEEPYSEEHILGIRTLSDVIRKAFGLSVVSMQSIWYGRTESIFGTAQERAALVNYTAQAADFAAAAGCKNLVFGCPRNRNQPEDADLALADEFFLQAAEAVQQRGCVLSLEPNPPIYHTNFLNTTLECADYLRRLNHPALRMNVDVGTLIHNAEEVSAVADNLDLVGHVHISRPGLAPVEGLALHRRLASVLKSGGYEGWVSIEMQDAGIPAITHAMEIVSREFGR